MEIRSFKWDEENINHMANHWVSPDEVEDVVFDDAPYLRKGRNDRRYLYGQTVGGRYLFVVYLILRSGEAKVITARTMDNKEKKLYLKQGK